MSALSQLVRLHTWSLDEKRRQAVELDRLADKLRADLARVEEELAKEQASTGTDLDLQKAFQAYAKVSHSRRERLLRSIAEVEKELLRAQAEVTEAYQELKRYEQALANRELRQRALIRRREQILNDELGLTIHQRRGDRTG